MQPITLCKSRGHHTDLDQMNTHESKQYPPDQHKTLNVHSRFFHICLLINMLWIITLNNAIKRTSAVKWIVHTVSTEVIFVRCNQQTEILPSCFCFAEVSTLMSTFVYGRLVHILWSWNNKVNEMTSWSLLHQFSSSFYKATSMYDSGICSYLHKKILCTVDL